MTSRLRIRICKNVGSRKLTLLSVARTGGGTASEWATFQAKASALLEIAVERMFDKSGAEIRALEVLEDGDLVVCSAGESFRPLRKKQPNPNAATAAAAANDQPTASTTGKSLVGSSSGALTREAIARHNSAHRSASGAYGSDGGAGSDGSLVIGSTFVGSTQRPAAAGTGSHRSRSERRKTGSTGSGGRRSAAAAAAAGGDAGGGNRPVGLDDPFGGSGADAYAMQLEVAAAVPPRSAAYGRSFTPDPTRSRGSGSSAAAGTTRSRSPFAVVRQHPLLAQNIGAVITSAAVASGVPRLLLPQVTGAAAVGTDGYGNPAFATPSLALLQNSERLNRQTGDDNSETADAHGYVSAATAVHRPVLNAAALAASGSAGGGSGSESSTKRTKKHRPRASDAAAAAAVAIPGPAPGESQVQPQPTIPTSAAAVPTSEPPTEVLRAAGSAHARSSLSEPPAPQLLPALALPQSQTVPPASGSADAASASVGGGPAAKADADASATPSRKRQPTGAVRVLPAKPPRKSSADVGGASTPGSNRNAAVAATAAATTATGAVAAAAVVATSTAAVAPTGSANSAHRASDSDGDADSSPPPVAAANNNSSFASPDSRTRLTAGARFDSDSSAKPRHELLRCLQLQQQQQQSATTTAVAGVTPIPWPTPPHLISTSTATTTATTPTPAIASASVPSNDIASGAGKLPTPLPYIPFPPPTPPPDTPESATSSDPDGVPLSSPLGTASSTVGGDPFRGGDVQSLGDSGNSDCRMISHSIASSQASSRISISTPPLLPRIPTIDESGRQSSALAVSTFLSPPSPTVLDTITTSHRLRAATVVPPPPPPSPSPPAAELSPPEHDSQSQPHPRPFSPGSMLSPSAVSVVGKWGGGSGSGSGADSTASCASDSAQALTAPPPSPLPPPPDTEPEPDSEAGDAITSSPPPPPASAAFASSDVQADGAGIEMVPQSGSASSAAAAAAAAALPPVRVAGDNKSDDKTESASASASAAGSPATPYRRPDVVVDGPGANFHENPYAPNRPIEELDGPKSNSSASASTATANPLLATPIGHGSSALSYDRETPSAKAAGATSGGGAAIAGTPAPLTASAALLRSPSAAHSPLTDPRFEVNSAAATKPADVQIAIQPAAADQKSLPTRKGTQPLTGIVVAGSDSLKEFRPHDPNQLLGLAGPNASANANASVFSLTTPLSGGGDGSVGSGVGGLGLGIRPLARRRDAKPPAELIAIDRYLRVFGYGYLDLTPQAPRTCGDIASTLFSWWCLFVSIFHTGLAIVMSVYWTSDRRLPNSGDTQLICLIGGFTVLFAVLRWRMQRSLAALFLTTTRHFEIDDTQIKSLLADHLWTFIIGKVVVVLFALGLIMIGALLPELGVATSNPVAVLFIADSRTELLHYVQFGLWCWAAVFTVPVFYDCYVLTSLTAIINHLSLEPFRLSIGKKPSVMALHTKLELYHRASALFRATCNELQSTIAVFMLVPFAGLVVSIANASLFSVTYFAVDGNSGSGWGVLFVFARILLFLALFLSVLQPLLRVNDSFAALRPFIDAQWQHCAERPIEHMAIVSFVSTPKQRWTVYGWAITGAIGRWATLITGVFLTVLILQYRAAPF